MFTTGIPHLGLAFFSAASTLVAVPTAVQIFAWIGTMWKGRPQLRLPMLHILGFFVTFVIGGLTGVMVAVVPFDWQAHDTAFVTAHLHYVLFGGFVFPILAALYYWLPHLTGRRRFFRIGEIAFVIIFIGFHGTFLAMHWVGLLGQRRRIWTYDADAGWTTINLISSISGFLVAFGLAIILIEVILNFFVAVRGQRNPWRAGSLEWAMMTPPAAYNFASLPHVETREPLSADPEIPVRLARGEGYLGTPRDNRRETLTVETATGAPDSLVIYPGNTHLPILMAAVTGAFFVSFLLKVYWLTPVALAGVAAFACRWVWVLGNRRDRGPEEVGLGIALPHASEVDRSPGWWGSIFLLVANAVFFGSLIFGYAFLFTVAPGWPPPRWFETSLLQLIAGVAGGGIAAAGMRLAIRSNRRGDSAVPGIALSGAGTLAVLVALAALLWRIPPPSEHAYNATLLVLGGYGAFHALLAMLMLGFLAARIVHGFVSPQRRAELPIVSLWVDYMAVICVLTLGVAHLPGMV
jgi:cytochrome c oxidase subunit I+III